MNFDACNQFTNDHKSKCNEKYKMKNKCQKFKLKGWFAPFMICITNQVYKTKWGLFWNLQPHEMFKQLKSIYIVIVTNFQFYFPSTLRSQMQVHQPIIPLKMANLS